MPQDGPRPQFYSSSFQVYAVFLFVLGSTFLQLSFLIQDGATPAAPVETAAPPVVEPAAPAAATPDAVAAAPGGAATDAARAAQGVAKPPQDAASPYLQFLPILIIGFFFYIILLRPQQREQRRRQELLNTLKKNDKVVTTGGLIGTIADISTDGKMVTLRVDDSTRIKFLRSAIQGLADDKAESASA